MNRIVIPQNATSTVCPVNVSEREAQIKALVDKRLNALIKQHEEEISGKTSEFTKNWFGKEFTLEEYKSMISEAEERLHNIPTDDYPTPHTRIAYQKTVEREIEYIKRDMQRMLDFKDYLRQVEKNIYERYPLNISQVIANVKRYVKNRISHHQKLITTDYHDCFMDKIKRLLPKDGKDYSKTISLIFRTRTNNKSMKTIYNFFKMLENKLTVAVSMFGNYNMNEYDKLQELLKSVVNRLIMVFYNLITKFLKEYIESIDNDEMDDSQTVRTYVEDFIDRMNIDLLQELPQLLNDAMKEEFDDMIEVLKVRSKEELGFNFLNYEAKPSPSISYTDGSPDVEVVITKPRVEEVITEPRVEHCAVSSKPKRDFTEFLKIIGDDPICADDIVKAYNNFFGVNVTIDSLSKRAEFKKNFNNQRVTRFGKKVKVYTKV